MKPKKTISMGKVNWFGGTNRNTGRVNDFGFISSYSAEDFYVRKNDIVNGNLLENQFVIFEEQKQKNGKKSAKNVQILFPKGEEAPQELLQLLSLSTITTNIAAVHSYKQHLVDWLNGPHSKKILNQFQKSRKIKASHLELIHLSNNTNDLFNLYIEKYNFNDLYESKISLEHIPDSYLIVNIKFIIEWWEAIDGAERQYDLLDKGISIIIRRSSFLTELTNIFSTEKIIELIRKIKKFPLNSKIIQLINKIYEKDKILNEYLQTATLDDLINCEVPMTLLPDKFLTNKVENAIEKIKLVEESNKLNVSKELLKLFLTKPCYIKSLLLDSKDLVAFALIKKFKIESPFNNDILNSIKDSKQLFVKYSGSYCLNDYIKAKVSINLMPEWYISDQINKLFKKLTNPHFFKKNNFPKELFSFLLSHSTYRFIAINQCKVIHPTNAFNLIQLLTNQDKLIEKKLFDRVINSQHKFSDIPSLLPLLSTQNSTFNDEFVFKNIGLIADWVQSLSDTERNDKLQKAFSYFDTSCLLALIFKGVLTTDDILDRISEINLFIFNLVRKQPSNVAPYLREIYKSCFSNLEEFSKNSVINPILLSNQTQLKIEQIKWKIYKQDLSFVNDVENDSAIASDPECWLLAKLLPLINPNNSYDTIEKVILHELWLVLLSGQIKVDHPSIFKLFPQCQTLATHFPHMALSCEAFIWQPKSTEDNPTPEAKYLCRSHICNDPQVLPNLNKSYLDYSAFDWLAHYGVMYSGGKGPERNDFPIKLAGYFNRIRELHERLHCRTCQQLMVPNMKYARVEAVTIDPQTGNKITTPVNAAYRLTVFHCNNPSCKENGIGHYINHCLGFKCYEIIDSRDLKEKCSEGRYICQNPDCRSCCPKHSSPQQHGVSDNITNKHKELYKDSPHFKSFKKQY